MPPKKDAFADLFQAATFASSSSSVNSTKNAKLGLADLAKLSNAPSPDPSRSSSAHPPNNWANLDLLSPSPSSQTSGSNSITEPARIPNDPFAIFDTTNTAAQPKPAQTQTEPVAAPQPVSSTAHENSHLLIDDEFTDAFVDEAPLKQSDPTPTKVQPSASPDTQKVDERDEIVAQLLDIGFSVEMANNAIDEVGLDLQSCVNFIMNGGKKQHRENRSRPANHARAEDLGTKLNDLSINLFSKASTILSKSRDTVMKNLEQFQSNSGSSSNDSLPAWMKEQPRYKKETLENKAGGGEYEDYGSEEDNIDQEAIRSFMEQQRIKDKERSRARTEHFKALAREKITGSSSPPKSPSAQSNARHSIAEGHLQEQVPHRRRVQTKKPTEATTSPELPSRSPNMEVDLLGLSSNQPSRAERFKISEKTDTVYVSSRRRRQAPNATVARKTVSTPLNQFQQSDYDVAKEKASKYFANGNYDDALINYSKCLAALPEKHELRVIINSNIAITLIKLGNYKEAQQHCEQGLSLIGKDELPDNDYVINEKPIKFWYIKLVLRKAEALELSEMFPQSLECYVELVTKLGVNDKKVMDAKRRISNIINPPPKPRSQKPSNTTITVESSENLRRVQEQNKKQEENDNLRFELHDKLQAKVFAWSNGKEDNLRTLLATLPNILPERLNFPFLTTKKITVSDLMLPKKVKINYMKVISAIHPDKLAAHHLKLEDEMLCQSVFIILNKSWDIFKEQNGMN